MTAKASLGLGPLPDIDRIAAQYRTTGRAQIPLFLGEPHAHALLNELKASEDWRLVLNSGDKVYEIDRPGQAAMTDAQKEELDQAVYAAARHGFQYRYETIRVPDEHALRQPKRTRLHEFACLMSSDAVLDTLRAITGAEDISFADAQATAYSPGHFLTAHDDGVAGKGRRAAYVLGLSMTWRVEWGGLLMFHGEDGRVAGVHVPAFNVLNLFAVPQVHSVSVVAPFAASPRYSITGWLRTPIL